MRIFFYLVAMLLGMGCTTPKKADVAREQIKSVLAEQGGVFAVAYKNPDTGEEILINEHEFFHAASTMKRPVMAEIYKQVAEGKLALTDSVLIKNSFTSIVDGSTFSLNAADDSEQQLYQQLGKKKLLSQLVYNMIVVSSNLATNLVIELADAKKVTATLRSMGATNIQVLRGVEDGKAYEKGLNNVVTAFDLMLLFEKIARQELVDAAASKDMVRILMDQKFNEIIPARLPADVKVAHKTGSITGVRHDSGIVFLPNGDTYVLVLLSKELTNPEKAIAAMAQVSEIIYRYHVSR